MRKSTLEKFRVFVNKQHGLDLKFGDYWQMHKWSITETNQFWNSLYDFAGVIGDKGAQPVSEADRVCNHIALLPERVKGSEAICTFTYILYAAHHTLYSSSMGHARCTTPTRR